MDLVPNYQNGVNLPHGRMPGLIERKDCPQDFTSEWIQRLFPSHDGMVFTENSHSADPLSHLTPRPLGKLLQRIAKVSDKDLENDTESLEQDLVSILNNNAPVGILTAEEREERKSEREEINKQILELKKEKRSYKPKNRGSYAKKIKTKWVSCKTKLINSIKL